VKRVNPMPTLLTLLNMVCGFGAMTLAMRATQFMHIAERTKDVQRMHEFAVALIFLAMIFDVFDGRVARMTGQTSRFGAELDSLSDMVSFGIAPALLVKSLLDISNWPDSVVRTGWVMLVLYVAGVAVRLARYNVEAVSPADGKVESKGTNYFVGLPSPAAAGMAVTPILLFYHIKAQGWGDPTWMTLVMPVLLLLMGWLMVSRVRYMHIGNQLFRGRQQLWPVLLILVLVVIAIGFWWVSGLVAFGGYVLGFLIWDLLRRARSARARLKLKRKSARQAREGQE